MKTLSCSFIILILVYFTSNAQKSNRQTYPIQLSWKVLEGQTQNGGEQVSEISIQNKGKQFFPTSGWSIYFNAADPRNADKDNLKIKLEHINGDYFKFVPGQDFEGLRPGEIIKIKVLSRFFKKQTDTPNGFYIVFDNDSSGPFLIKTGVLSIQNDHEEFELAKKTYQQNQLTATGSNKNLSAIFPTPLFFQKNEEVFSLDKGVKIITDPSFKSEANYLANELGKVLGITPAIVASAPNKTIILKKKAITGSEAYELSVRENQVTISASTSAGVFYGIQSLKMLLPTNSWKGVHASVPIKGVEVKDEPRFPHRAFMMDLARNFQPKTVVLKLLDLLALYKINVLHLHLNDDEGWRIAISGLPELTSVGSKRGHDMKEKRSIYPSYGSGPYVNQSSGSGFYSKTDFIEILKYANQRHISVIPEFESPGHARAAIKSMDVRYQRLMKAGQEKAAKQYLLRDLEDQSIYRSVQGWNDNVINPALPSVYNFIQKIVDETVAMYQEAGAPLKTIHFGGDEVPSGVWEKSPAVDRLIKGKEISSVDELCYYYFSKVSKILEAKNLYLSGWEEVGERKIIVNGEKKMVLEPRFFDQNVHLDVWNNLSGNEDLAYRLANAGYKVVLTNVTNLYLDLSYNKSYQEPGQYWGGYVDVDKLFSFIPLNYYKNQKENTQGEDLTPEHFDGMEHLSEAGKKNIVGLQASLWSEKITDKNEFEYLLLPKLLGFA
jgi:hexosaminidase